MVKTEILSVSDLIFFDTKPILEIKIDYPQIQGFMPDRAEKRINSFFENDAKRQNRTARTVLAVKAKEAYLYSRENAFPFHLWSYLQTVEETFSGRDKWSLYADRYVYSGGAHGDTLRRGFTFSLKTGRRLSLSEVCPVGQKEILASVVQEIRRSEEGIYFEDAEMLAVRNFDPKNFYLTKEGVTVFYPLYTIAPYSSGIREFLIPCFRENGDH